MRQIQQSTLSRRRFLENASVAALGSAFAVDSMARAGATPPAAAATPSTVATRSAAAATRTHAIGVQLYTMQSLLVKDFAGTLGALEHVGYREVETVGMLGHDPKSYRAALDAAGLKAPSSHVLSAKAQDLFIEMATGRVPMDKAWEQINASMDLTHIEAIMENMFAQSESVGNHYLILASVDGTLFDSRAGIDKVTTAFRKAGELCQKKGLQFGWHPHLDDFKIFEGKRAIDWVMEGTDPSRVLVELDFFWAVMAAVDVPALLSRYSGRFHLGHVKDMATSFVVPAGGWKDLNTVPDGSYEDVGYGRLDYRSWIPLARKAGMRHFFVERDSAPHPLENVTRSFGSLREII